jgi:chemotaxis receptor (MCP) glutamine deamidase CheD
MNGCNLSLLRAKITGSANVMGTNTSAGERNSVSIRQLMNAEFISQPLIWVVPISKQPLTAVRQ